MEQSTLSLCWNNHSLGHDMSPGPGVLLHCTARQTMVKATLQKQPMAHCHLHRHTLTHGLLYSLTKVIDRGIGGIGLQDVLHCPVVVLRLDGEHCCMQETHHIPRKHTVMLLLVGSIMLHTIRMSASGDVHEVEDVLHGSAIGFPGEFQVAMITHTGLLLAIIVREEPTNRQSTYFSGWGKGVDLLGHLIDSQVHCETSSRTTRNHHITGIFHTQR